MQLESRPRFSVLTSVFDPAPDHLRACLASVRAQTFTDFEHIIVDDGSTDPSLLPVMAEAESDPRVLVIRRAKSGGIVAAGRDGLAAATGEFVAFLDHDGVLEHDALATMHERCTADIDVAYSDHDYIAPDGFYVEATYKPDFSPERVRAQNYITNFLAARRTLVDAVGGFRDGYDGAHDHDLVLRLTAHNDRVAHVPRILYHCRKAAASVSARPNEPWAFAAGARAVADHCSRVGIDAAVETTAFEGCYRVVRRLRERPLVSIVIPTRGSRGVVWGIERCFVVDAVRSIAERSSYRELEFVIVYDADTEIPVLDAVRRVAGGAVTTFVPFDGPFNFSTKVNLGVAATRGRLVLLLNDDTELIAPTSVEVLVGHVLTPGVAAAGAKLLFADGTLQHGGHVYAHEPDHTCIGWRGDSAGPWPLRPLAVERECSGVTAACTLIRRDVFDAFGGFDVDLPNNYNDVDFCLKVRAAGHRIVWTPWALWHHFESRTRVRGILPQERDRLDQRWHAQLVSDPYYNANFVPHRNDFLERVPPAGLLWREPRVG